MKRACGCSYGGVGLGEKYLNTNFEAVQIVAANLEQILALTTAFSSPNGTVANAGGQYDLKLDVDIPKLSDQIQSASATEMAGISASTFAYLNIGGTIKKVPLSLLQALNTSQSLHVAGATMPLARADGTPLREGDIWYDAANDQLMTHNGSIWFPVGNRVVEGSTFGLAPRKGDMWWDTDNEVLLIYVGGRWIDVSSTVPPSKWTESATPPVSPAGGDRWYDTVNSVELVYVTSLGAWV